MIKRQDFFKKYNINTTDFNSTGLKWEHLEKIHSDYTSAQSYFDPIAKHINDMLLKNENIHSTRFRIKSPDHLVEKIIRKRIREPKREIDLSNYKQEITDLVGVRALHLFKSDWIDIDNYIRQKFRISGYTVAYIREGDNPKIKELYKKNKCQVEIHPFGYRSVHYLVVMPLDSKNDICCEIQVRTVFEEGWSEIDHRLRYPYCIGNPMLEEYLSILNSLAGNADDMGTFILYFLQYLENQDKEKEDLKHELDSLQQKFDELKLKSPERKIIGDGIGAISGRLVSRAIPTALSFNDTLRSSLFDVGTCDYSVFLNSRTCKKCGMHYSPIIGMLDDGHCTICTICKYSPSKSCSSCGREYIPAILALDSGLCDQCKMVSLGITKTCLSCGKQYQANSFAIDSGFCKDCKLSQI